MTPGHQRAIRELERLQVTSGGDIEFTSDGVDESSDMLGIRLSIRLGPLKFQTGGLELREREDFVLRVPPGFPFDIPSVRVTHTRFAGFPHVIWKHWICLYQSKLEWNPAQGLYGFFERLDRWLCKASMNDMDPVEGPLEPPHHNTDFSQKTFVMRANAPKAAGESWVGFAELEPQKHRMEVVGWKDFDEELSAGRKLALAVVLPNALPMEFPTMGEELFLELMKQGFDRAKILLYLSHAALLAAEGEPVYFLIGLPMRRAADGSPRLHIAVWCADADSARRLRMVVETESDGESLRELRKELADAVYDVFRLTAISWCNVMEDRPEIIVRRDSGSQLTWFLGKRVLILGCGALGSWAAEMVSRAGAATLHLVDSALVKPGLLARQNYVSYDIGAKKAASLAVRLEALVSPGVIIEGFHDEAHHFVTSDVQRFSNYDVVLDCTASHITQMKIERDWLLFAKRTPPMVSVITDARAQQGLCVVIPRGSAGGIWNAYVLLKYRLCGEDKRGEVISAFYERDAIGQLFQPEPGCSDPTFSGSTANAMGVTAAALNLACEHGLVKEAGVGIAFGVPGTKKPNVQIVAHEEMEEFISGAYRVRIATKVGREARAWVRQNNRLRSKEHETGGLLWGMWDDATGIIWIFDASGPPADSRHDPAHFLCGVDGTALEHKCRFEQSRGTSGFIGFWHTHPDMSSRQSGTDIGGMAVLVSTLGQDQKRALMLIYGRSDARPTAGIYVYESLSVRDGMESVSVGETQITLSVPVV